MGSKLMSVCAVAVLLALGSAPLMSQTRVNRITQELSASTVATVKLSGSVHPMTRRGEDLGMVSGDKALESMTLYIGPSAAQQKDLDTLLAAQQDPKSPLYRQWLTQEEFGARFGATNADLQKMKTWLTGQGFAVKSVAPSQNMITFSGTVAQAEAAFRTQVHRYKVEGQLHIANSTEVSLPRALAGVVKNVGGLNSFRPKPRAIFTKPTPEFTSMNSGNHFLTPGDWATIYNVTTVYGSATGSGMHVGIVGQTYFPKSDIDKFRAAAGLPATQLTYKCISSANCTNTAGESVLGDMGEADLDVEWAGGIAKNATVDYIYASAADQTQGVYEALTYAITTYKVNSAVVPVVSMSYGNCESDFTTANGGTAFRQQMDGVLAQAAAQGQTILNSSGDAGAAGCDQGNTVATGGAVADWPASSPNVVGVGGTTFVGDANQTYSGPYWTGSNVSDTINSAIQYIPEGAWNDTILEQGQNANASLSSGGGGVSQFYPLPNWQWSPDGYSGTLNRFVPDVAFAASADHDGYLVCTQVLPDGATSASQSTGSTCVTGFRYSNGGLSVFGGTSAGSPSFAGMLTLMVQKHGKLGNLNPQLYALAGNASTYQTVFHDVTNGDNKQPCTSGTGCSGGVVGYNTGVGYDLATGLGSINAGALDTALTGGASLTATTTAVSFSPSSLNLGDTVTITATVSPAAATGTVEIRANGVVLGTPTLSNGTASVTVAATKANGLVAGVDNVTAKYTGDTKYAASGSSASLTVIGLASSVSFAVQSTAQTTDFLVLSATVSPSATTGSITYKIGNTVLGTSVVINGQSSALTVAVSKANGFTVGTDTITASYSGDSVYRASSSSAALTVTQGPTYTMSTSSTSVTLGAGTSTTVPIAMTSSNYAGTVSFSVASSSPGLVAASVPSVTLTNGGTGTATLTISAAALAKTQPPAMPWKSGGTMLFCTVLLGAPLMRRKRALAVLLTAAVIAMAGFTMACGGGGGSSSAKTQVNPRSYLVVVTPTGSGTVENASPITFTVTVP